MERQMEDALSEHAFDEDRSDELDGGPADPNEAARAGEPEILESDEPETPGVEETAAGDGAARDVAFEAPVPASVEEEIAAAPEADAEAADGAEPAAAVTEGEEEEEGEALPEEDTRGDWYFVHTYAGYENKVKTNLETRIVSMNMEEKIYEVVIPTEDVVEIKGGKKQRVQRKLFPGYLLVRMEVDDDSWYVVRNTPGVTGFVGSAAKPVPLTEREVDRILQRKQVEAVKPKFEHQINDPVRVTTGPFANFQGVISEIDLDRSKVKVLVNIFGRETPVELGFDQIAKV